MWNLSRLWGFEGLRKRQDLSESDPQNTVTPKNDWESRPGGNRGTSNKAGMPELRMRHLLRRCVRRLQTTCLPINAGSIGVGIGILLCAKKERPLLENT